MKITVTSGNEHLLTEYVSLNEEGLKIKEEAAAAKKAAEEEAAAAQKAAEEEALKKSTEENFQNTLDMAVASIGAQAEPVVTTTTIPGTLDSFFEEASATYGVDKQLLLAVARTESNFTADATSSAGAMGIMQLMPATAEGLGVENPYDAKENIMGGAQLLSDLLAKYNGDTSLALAAYNAGSGTVAKYGNTVPPSIQGYVDKVMGYYDEKVQAPDAPITTTVTSDSETYKTSQALRTELSKFPEYQSYDAFMEELAKEMSDETLPSDTNDAYKLFLAKSQTALDKIIQNYGTPEDSSS